MTRLLVSVRDPAEASAALAGGADLIDVKEPRRGSLGAASVETIQAVIAIVSGRAPTSAACGELLDGDVAFGAALPATLAFAKLGLAGCAACEDWADRWRRWANSLPASVAPVAVVYADYRRAAAPCPEEILGVVNGVSAIVLVDTWDKSAGRLLDHWSIDRLRVFANAVRSARCQLVVAGSLTSSDLEDALTVRPDYLAVRGAVCDGTREGVVSEQKVRNLFARLRSQATSRRAADNSCESAHEMGRT